MPPAVLFILEYLLRILEMGGVCGLQEGLPDMMALNFLIELQLADLECLLLINFLLLWHFPETGTALQASLLHFINRILVVVFKQFVGRREALGLADFFVRGFVLFLLRNYGFCFIF